jgi:hypothetical protein
MTHNERVDDYRRLADQCRKAARTASTQEERDDLLDRAKTWDFLADHPPRPENHRRELKE